MSIWDRVLTIFLSLDAVVTFAIDWQRKARDHPSEVKAFAVFAIILLPIFLAASAGIWLHRRWAFGIATVLMIVGLLAAFSESAKTGWPSKRIYDVCSAVAVLCYCAYRLWIRQGE